jgi:hypothetical protein
MLFKLPNKKVLRIRPLSVEAHGQCFVAVSEKQILQILVNVPFYQSTNIIRNAKTFGFYHLHLADDGVGNEIVDGTRLLDRMTNELIMKHNAVSDRRTIFYIQEWAYHTFLATIFMYVD